ncbi:MFS transporter [Marivita sp. GX14005]|uniref:MFS transporter n=1 Tax=Marivita sp. GX14005 TaxID=2942276 RepID=UPI0020186403|nr:MFS transporter [Marivita sp. GX14005]MCL3881537.1 MFS transporter [Marivita sp. GX14005]
MSEPSMLDSRYSWLRLGITLLIAVMGNVGMWAIIVVLPEVQSEFGAGRGEVSLAYTLTMVGFALGNFFVGRAVDRFGVAKALIACALTLTTCYILAALSPSLLILSALQLVIGFATACSFGPLIADVSQWFLKRRGIAVAITASGNYLSGAIWPLLLGSLGGGESWRWSYTALGILTLVIVPPLALMLRRRVPLEAIAAADTQSASRTRATGFTPRQLQWMLGAAGIACCVAMSMPQVHIVALCVDYGFGAAVGAEMLSLMLMGGVVSRLVSGTLADRIGGIPTLLIGSSLQAIALFLYLPAGGLVSLYTVSLIFGLSQSGIVPSYAVIVREYMPSREAGARVGFVLMMTITGMAVGGWLSGVIYDVTGSYQWAFVNGIVWNGLNIAIMIVILMRSQGPRKLRTAAA